MTALPVRPEVMPEPADPGTCPAIRHTPRSPGHGPAARSAWREPWVWLIGGIPALTIVAGLTTWWIAAQRADSDVADDHYRRGLGINRVLQRDEFARSRGIEARILLPVAGGDPRVQVLVLGIDPAPDVLVLQLTHPVQAAQDRRMTLAIQPDGSYRAGPDAVLPQSGQWALSIETAQWRLAGQSVRLDPGAVLTLPQPERTAR